MATLNIIQFECDSAFIAYCKVSKYSLRREAYCRAYSAPHNTTATTTAESRGKKKKTLIKRKLISNGSEERAFERTQIISVVEWLAKESFAASSGWYMHCSEYKIKRFVVYVGACIPAHVCTRMRHTQKGNG